MPNHAGLSERCEIKRWYTKVAFGLKVLGVPNQSRGETRSLRVQSWPWYHNGPFILSTELSSGSSVVQSTLFPVCSTGSDSHGHVCHVDTADLLGLTLGGSAHMSRQSGRPPWTRIRTPGCRYDNMDPCSGTRAGSDTRCGTWRVRLKPAAPLCHFSSLKHLIWLLKSKYPVVR